MRFGDVTIDLETHQIDGPAGTHIIEPKVMDVLAVLIDNCDHVVSREDLIDKVWGVGHGGDERLSRAISLLRKALGDKRGKHRFIQTIPSSGYKFTGTMNSVSEGADSANVNTSKHRLSKLALWGLIAFAACSIALTAFLNLNSANSPAGDKTPLVVIMDSAHPARIYDGQVRIDGGTNADILSDILADLPIRTQKELVSPTWHRYEAIAKFEPDLIVVHYSGFKQEDASGARPQLKLLIEYFQETDTKFLIYSRAGQDWLASNMDIILEDLYQQNPALRDRVDVFPLLEYGDPYWMDAGPAQGIKLKIKDILALE